jgi:hypothetical protein
VIDDDTSDDDILPVKRKRDESLEEAEKDAGVPIQQQEQCEERAGTSATKVLQEDVSHTLFKMNDTEFVAYYVRRHPNPLNPTKHQPKELFRLFQLSNFEHFNLIWNNWFECISTNDDWCNVYIIYVYKRKYNKNNQFNQKKIQMRGRSSGIRRKKLSD